MDLVTQGILGAAIGQGFYAKKLGSRAKWIGAALGLFPDCDVLFTQDPIKAMYLHRGYTHSLPVCLLLGIFFGYLFWRYFHPQKPELKKEWIGLGILALITHPLLDLFTAYGTQLFLPITNHRYALDAVSVIDLFYTVPLILILILGAFYKRHQAWLAKVMLTLTTLYLGAGVYWNHKTIETARVQLQAAPEAEITSYPQLFQPFLRTVLYIDGHTVKSGLYSLLADNDIPFQTHVNPEGIMIDALVNTKEAEIFAWFSQNKQTRFILPAEKACFNKNAKATTTVTNDEQPRLVRFTDARYTTLTDPFEGLWGVEALVTKKGQLVSDVHYFRKYRAVNPATIQGFWLAIWDAAIHGPSLDKLDDYILP